MRLSSVVRESSFRVMARNNSGVWNEGGDSLDCSGSGKTILRARILHFDSTRRTRPPSAQAWTSAAFDHGGREHCFSRVRRGISARRRVLRNRPWIGPFDILKVPCVQSLQLCHFSWPLASRQRDRSCALSRRRVCMETNGLYSSCLATQSRSSS